MESFASFSFHFWLYGRSKWSSIVSCCLIKLSWIFLFVWFCIFSLLFPQLSFIQKTTCRLIPLFLVSIQHGLQLHYLNVALPIQQPYMYSYRANCYVKCGMKQTCQLNIHGWQRWGWEDRTVLGRSWDVSLISMVLTEKKCIMLIWELWTCHCCGQRRGWK